jgi:photosystem II stability/assembly factor-like uncharacterized protein
MKFLTRKRVLGAAIVAAFVVVFAAVGALSRSSSTAAPPAPLPFAPWYWTMAVSPSDPNVLVLGTSQGLYRSGDGGKTWQTTGPTGVSTTSLVQAGSSIFMGGVPAKPTTVPIAQKGAVRSAPNGTAVLAVSTDGGKSWKELHPKGLPNVTVQALAVDPADSASLYALLNDGKLYRSTDDAGSFQLVSAKLGIPPWALAITQNNHFVGGDMDSGSYLSATGQSWQHIPYTDGRSTHMVMEYAVEPKDATRVLMTSIGIEISTDSGKTWHPALRSKVMFGPVAWAGGATGVAYAVGFDRSVWRSDDAGKSWKKVA